MWGSIKRWFVRISISPPWWDYLDPRGHLSVWLSVFMSVCLSVSLSTGQNYSPCKYLGIFTCVVIMKIKCCIFYLGRFLCDIFVWIKFNVIYYRLQCAGTVKAFPLKKRGAGGLYDQQGIISFKRHPYIELFTFGNPYQGLCLRALPSCCIILLGKWWHTLSSSVATSVLSQQCRHLNYLQPACWLISCMVNNQWKQLVMNIHSYLALIYNFCGFLISP